MRISEVKNTVALLSFSCILNVVLVLVFALAAQAQDLKPAPAKVESSAPKPVPLSDPDRGKMAILRLKAAATENELRALIEQHTAAKQRMEKLVAEYNAALADLQKKSNAPGCGLDFDQEWVCPEPKPGFTK